VREVLLDARLLQDGGDDVDRDRREHELRYAYGQTLDQGVEHPDPRPELHRRERALNGATRSNFRRRGRQTSAGLMSNL
jgi:hypothetical protein